MDPTPQWSRTCSIEWYLGRSIPSHIDAAGSVKRNRTGSDIEDGQVATVLVEVSRVDYAISVDVVKLPISIGVDTVSGTGVERRSGEFPVMNIQRIGEGSPDVGFRVAGWFHCSNMYRRTPLC